MRFLRIFFVLVFIAFISLSGISFFNFLGPNVRKEKERFVINLGTKEDKIVSDLVSKGFLKKKNLFYFILEIKGWRGKIEPGAYMISDSFNAYQLAKTLISGPYQKWVVIPPGKRKEQVALIIKKVLNWDNSVVIDFIKSSKEGYLFPDTYLFDVTSNPQQLISKLMINFNEKFDIQIQKDLFTQNVRNDSAIKIASLIERESGGETDKAIIAGIIWNRLNKKMRLEIDATIQYAMATDNCELDSNTPLLETCNFWPTVTGSDIRSNYSSYNTYIIEELPPGPISSPSLSSIRAVAYSAETEALYYLHSADKQIHIAKTFKEHKENIKKYLR